MGGKGDDERHRTCLSNMGVITRQDKTSSSDEVQHLGLVTLFVTPDSPREMWRDFWTLVDMCSSECLCFLSRRSLYMYLSFSPKRTSSLLFKKQLAWNSLPFLFTIFRKPHAFARTFTSDWHVRFMPLWKQMEAKSLFTELCNCGLFIDRGRAVSVCWSWSVVSFRSSLWRNKDRYGTTVLTLFLVFWLSKMAAVMKWSPTSQV